MNNEKCYFGFAAIDEIFRIYSVKYPSWHLKRYYTQGMRVLDHIYHCMRQGTAKEILYKSGLDELEVNVYKVDEINLLSTRPSDIYDGVSMRTLRTLNCSEGTNLLNTVEKRAFVKKLQNKFPVIFNEPLNDAQCKYLEYLMESNLTVGEVGRLFQARRIRLTRVWCPSQYKVFLCEEHLKESAVKLGNDISAIDPIYKKYWKGLNEDDWAKENKTLEILYHYLILNREKYDAQFRRSNRKRYI